MWIMGPIDITEEKKIFAVEEKQVWTYLVSNSRTLDDLNLNEDWQTSSSITQQKLNVTVS